jgi:glycosyltransferase involved in cell wall biosynthesis
MNKTKVTIIIPIYNSDLYLERCLDSVCCQTLKKIEIICINDASTDNSFRIVTDYAKKDKRIIARQLRNRAGASQARNTALSIAHGVYIGFCDSDDYVDKDYYEKLYDAAQSCDADISKAEILIHNINGETHKATDNDFIAFNKSYFYQYFFSAIYKRNLIIDKKIKFLDIRNGEDIAFTVKAVHYSNKIVLVNKTFYHYVKHIDSTSTQITKQIVRDVVYLARDTLRFIDIMKYEEKDCAIVAGYIFNFCAFVINKFKYTRRAFS